jgi:hypothetical protein
VFEHVPFPWASILELARVLKPTGHVFITVPSRGHVHSHYDCWRMYPDGLRALAAFARLDVRETHTDFPPLAGRKRHDYASIDAENHYWGDSVGVFQKPQAYPSVRMWPIRQVVIAWANRVAREPLR